MIKDIVKDSIFLSQPCQPGTAEDIDVVQDLMDTYNSMSKDCACLAANQIGYPKAIVLCEIKEEPLIMFNPRIKMAKRQFEAVEGCLSLDTESKVNRYATIKVAFEELVDGELAFRVKTYKDWDAEVIQHAIDHTKGRVI